LRLNKTAILIFFLFSIAFGYFYQDPGANGNSRLALTMSMVKEGKLNIDTFNSETGGYKSTDIASFNGKTYTDKAIGSSIFAAMIYFPIFKFLQVFNIALIPEAEKHLLTYLVIGLPSAIAGTMMFLLAEFISKRRFFAYGVTLALTLGTMAFPFSVIFFGHQLAATFLYYSVFLMYYLKTQSEKITKSLFITGLIGFFLGMAFLTEMTTAVAIVPLILYYFIIQMRRNQLRNPSVWIIPGICGLIPLLVMFFYNYQVYGEPFVSGYQYLVDETFFQGMSQGFMGIGRPSLHVLFYETFHPAQCIFWQSPVLLLSLIGGVMMLKNKSTWLELILAVQIIVSYLLINAGYYMWWGGWSFGIRHVIPMLPFFSLLLAHLPYITLPVFGLLATLSIGQMLIVCASNVLVPDKVIQTIARLDFFSYSTIYNECLQMLQHGNFAWNMGNAWFGLSSWVSLIPLILLIGIVTILIWRLSQMDEILSVQV
jgi:hypothetical protein